MNGRYITIKSDEEFSKMEIAGRCVAAIHDTVRSAATPGASMKELDAIAAAIIQEHDCRPSFLGYHGFPATICTSPNEVIVHGIPGDYRLVDGDILSIDAGAIYDGWHADAAFTMAVGTASDDAEQLLKVTEEALWAGMAQALPGNRLGDIGHAVESAAKPHGYGVVHEYVGHGIGQQMHEAPSVPNLGQAGQGMRLKAGMALAIEPMFNLGTGSTRVESDGWTVVTADGALSAHFEHTVAITEAGPRVITVSEPHLVG